MRLINNGVSSGISNVYIMCIIMCAQCVFNLCLTQVICRDHIAAVTNKYRILEPMKIMLEPFSKRFSYHFYGNRVTNNIDKVIGPF